MLSKPIMNICFHISKKFLYYTYVPMKSILVNNPEYCIHFYLISNSFEEKDLDEFYCLAGDFGAQITIVRAPELLYLENERTKLEAMLFMDIFFLLPNNIDRALILDADIVVKSSLQELYEMDIDNSYVACVDDAYVDKTGVNSWMHYFSKMKLNVFSSVCVLCNLKKIRNEISRNDIKVASQKIEDIFNLLNAELTYALVFKDKIKYFSEIKYGLYISNIIERNFSDNEIEKLIDECVVVHYFRAHPWSPGMNFSKLQRVWWEYAKDTPYYDEYLKEFWASWRNLRKREVMQRADALIVTLCSEFEYYFSAYKDCRIILYGTGEKTKILIEKMKNYNIVGVLDREELNTGLFIDNVPILSLEKANEIGDMIIIATIAKVWKEIYLRIKGDIDKRIEIYNLHGENMREAMGEQRD